MTTDFGLKDPFVGLMKGAILGINPDVFIVDITHQISRHNIFEASQTLSMSYRYFPSGTLHIVVVDPGVGGNRRPIMVVTKDHYFIGPDNGVFTSIYEELESTAMRVIHLTATHHFLPMSGSTFHGRDIFAPVAAWFMKKIDSSKFGEDITDYVTIPSAGVTIRDGKLIQGVVVSIDIYGNAITNIRKKDVEEMSANITGSGLRVIYRDTNVPMVDYYQAAGASEDSLSALINSFGLIELYVFKQSAAEKFGISIGDEVSVTLS